MTAWSANVLSSAMCLPGNGPLGRTTDRKHADGRPSKTIGARSSIGSDRRRTVAIFRGHLTIFDCGSVIRLRVENRRAGSVLATQGMREDPLELFPS